MNRLIMLNYSFSDPNFDISDEWHIKSVSNIIWYSICVVEFINKIEP